MFSAKLREYRFLIYFELWSVENNNYHTSTYIIYIYIIASKNTQAHKFWTVGANNIRKGEKDCFKSLKSCAIFAILFYFVQEHIIQSRREG